MSKNKLTKYYAHRKGETQLFSVKAKSDEEAAVLFEEKLGTKDFIYGKQLQRGGSKLSWKEQFEIMERAFGTEFAEFADKLHDVGAL